MQPQTGAQAGGPAAAAEVVMSSLHGGLQWAVDRMLSIVYGLVYDYIFEQFGPYQQLRAEVLGVVENSASTPDTRDRRAYQIVDVDCGPGNLTFVLAEAGFSVLGLEPYGALVELAREKRRAKRLANLAFSPGALSNAKLRDAAYDMVVNVHTLYAQDNPQLLLAHAYRVLKPRRGAPPQRCAASCCGCCRTACSRRRAGRSARTTGARTSSAGTSARPASRCSRCAGHSSTARACWCGRARMPRSRAWS